MQRTLSYRPKVSQCQARFLLPLARAPRFGRVSRSVILGAFGGLIRS
jgi:hypothetical protein